MIDAARTYASSSPSLPPAGKGEGVALVNGNITELERYAGVDKIDDLEYYYDHSDHTAKLDLGSNKLYLVDEQSTHTGGNDLKSGTKTAAGFDRNDDATWNYHYDPIGNLIKDVNDSIDLITWTVTGKVSEVVFDPDKQNYNLAFRYDPMGNRIAKIEKPHATLANCTTWTVTWYARDAQGNVLTVYNKPENSLVFSATEFNIYGSSRLGMVTQPEQLNENPSVPEFHSQTLGLKVYEFSNHLGNVLTTFSDRKIAIEGTPSYVTYYIAEILSSTDYYPFGFEMPGRSYTGGGYRYGFNSMEKDDEIKGSGNSYDFGARIYDPRVGRWLAVDPLAGKYPDISPFVFVANSPLVFIDPDGKKIEIYYKTGETDSDGNEIYACWEYKPGIDVPDNEFLILVVSQIELIASVPVGHAIVKSLYENQNFSVRLIEATGNYELSFEMDDPIAARENNIYHGQTRDNNGNLTGKHDSEYPIGSGGVIKYDPSEIVTGGLSISGRSITPAIFGLSHELFHASQSFTGDIEDSFMTDFGILQSEFEAVHFENIIRASFGNELRQWYDKSQRDNVRIPLVNECGNGSPAELLKNGELLLTPEYNYQNSHQPQKTISND